MMSHYMSRTGFVQDVGHREVVGRETSQQEDEGGTGPYGQEHPQPAPQSYPGCFGLPYQDHNYGAPRPPTPPPSPPQPPQQMLMPPLAPLTPDKGHIEVEDVGSSAGLPITPPEVVPPKEGGEDDSVTRCICDFIHDDGYMICCDKCSVWQHIDCMGVDRNNIPDSYFCELCEPRQLDREKARLIQLKKKEFLDTLTDSSATDTDPEEEANRQLSQQQQGGVDLTGARKLKTKKHRNKSGNNNSNNGSKASDVKQRRNSKKDKRDVKKEKENKDANKKYQRVLNKDTPAGVKAKKLKLEKNKKPGLSLVINENTQQDPWDSSYSPWVDKYEEVYENLYSQDVLNSFLADKINGVYPPDNNGNGVGGKLRVQLCHVTEVNKNRKGLEAMETIGEGEPVVEYIGQVMYRDQFNKDNFYKRLNPFVLFYSNYDGMDICIDATSYGNIARFIRRSCKANAEVRHVIQNGQMNFYVYSTKVIPRGSEITIPYDYSYKDCTYCVECACLRNNCPVAKFFKKRMNNLKKEKSPQKMPKLPVKSPIKLQIKSPVKKSVEELSPLVNAPNVTSPAVDRPAEVMSRAASTEQIDNGSTCPDLMETAPQKEEEETSETGTTPSSSEPAVPQHKMTREERKMEAIMKAFEKLEKREERRNQALHRIDRKSVDIKKEEKPEKVEKTPAKKEEKKDKVNQKETRSRKKEEEESAGEPAQEAVISVETEPVQEESVVDVVPEEQPVIKETKPKPKTRKAKRVSTRRRNRAGSGNAVSEPSLSVDTADEGSSAAQPNISAMANSCPNTPLVTSDVANMQPSFRFLKTKKHLMNEWLHEKGQDGAAGTSSPAKTEPLEVKVEDDTMFVTCLPSPRNAMEHLRRNSHSSGTFRPVVNADNSIGSAKKRWLRQAMIEKPKIESGPNSPNTTGGGNASPSLPSPGASPPGDFVTPLKKRRMARESIDTPLSAGPSTSSPSVTPGVIQPGDSESQPPDVQEEVKPFSPIYTPSIKMEIPKKRAFVSPRDLRKASIRDSMESEVSDSSATVSSRVSVDQSSDSEQEHSVCPQKVTGSSSSTFHTELVSMEDRTSRNDQSLLSDTSHTCEVTNSSEEDQSVNCGVHGETDKLDSTSDSVQRQVELNVEEDENVSSGLQARPSEAVSEEEEVEVEDQSVSVNLEVDPMEVDSTEDQREKPVLRRSVCDSTSRSDVGSSACSSGVDSCNNSVTEASCSTSVMEEVCHPSSMTSHAETSIRLAEPQRVDSSTDTLSSQTQEGGMEVDELPMESNSQQEESSVEERLPGVDSSVGSSSDQQGSRNGGGVSSSSELRQEDSVVESTHLSEGGRVTSSAVVTSDNSVLETDMVDSSVSDRFEITVEAELVNVSDIGQALVDNTASSNPDSSFHMGRHSEELSCTSSHQEVGSEIHNEDDNSRSDSLTITTPSEPSASPADSEPPQGAGLMEPEAEPAPTKKKVSLLEYRKRLKGKGPSSSSSSTSSSSSSVPRPSSTSSLSPSFSVHSRLPSLPSLPLFDTSPSKESLSHNHRQFKSSSDLIRRKSTEAPKREKPLSLTERLKMEFGFEDSEDDSSKEERSLNRPRKSSHDMPPPPPPPPSEGSGAQPYETAPAEPPPPPQQPPQQLGANFKAPLSTGYTGLGGVQPPQIPHSIHGDHPHRMPSPGMVPAPTMVPPPPQGPHNGNMMMPGQVPLMNHGGPPPQPVPPPAPVPPPSNGPMGSHMGQAPTVGQKIPSLMSIPSYHTKGRSGHTQGGSNAANLAQPVNGHHDPGQQPYVPKPGLPSHIQQPFSSVAQPASFTHPPPQPVPAPFTSAPPNQQYPIPPQARPQQPYPQQQQQGQHFIPPTSHPNHYQTPPPQAPTGGSQYVQTTGPSPAVFHTGQHQAAAPYSQNSAGSYNSYQSSSYQQQPANGHPVRDYKHGYKNSHDSEQQSHYNHSPKNYHGSSSHHQKSKKSKHRKSGSSRTYSDYR